MSYTTVISANKKAKALRAYKKSSIPVKNLENLTFPEQGEFNDAKEVE